MSKKNKQIGFWGWWWQNLGYTVGLSLLVLIQILLLVALGVGVYFLGDKVGWWVVAVAVGGWWLLLAVSLGGISKNMVALMANWGQGRYPLFSIDYWLLGAKVMVMGGGLFLPVILGVIGSGGWYLTESLSWLGAMIIFWGVMIFWHWRFGLAMSLLADGEHSLNWCIKRSWILTGRRKWWSLGWLLFDYGVILLSGIIIPVVGVVIGMSLVLTLTFWGQKILENN